MRPFEMWSMVAICLARIAGFLREWRGDQRAELDVLGDRGDGRQLAPGLEDRQLRHDRHAVDVVAHPDVVVAESVELERGVRAPRSQLRLIWGRVTPNLAARMVVLPWLRGRSSRPRHCAVRLRPRTGRFRAGAPLPSRVRATRDRRGARGARGARARAAPRSAMRSSAPDQARLGQARPERVGRVQALDHGQRRWRPAGRRSRSRRRSAGTAASTGPAGRRPGVPNASRRPSARRASDGVSVVRGRLPGARALGCSGSSTNICARVPIGKPSSGITGDDGIQAPLGVQADQVPRAVGRVAVRGVARARATPPAPAAPRAAGRLRNDERPAGGQAAQSRAQLERGSLRIHERASLLGVGVREQLVDRYVGETRVGVAGLAVGERELRALEPVCAGDRRRCAPWRRGRSPRAGAAAAGTPGPGSTAGTSRRGCRGSRRRAAPRRRPGSRPGRSASDQATACVPSGARRSIGRLRRMRSICSAGRPP